MNTQHLIIDDRFPDGIRIDRYLTLAGSVLSRSQLKQRLVQLAVNGKEVKPGKRVFPGDSVQIGYADPLPVDLVAEDMPLTILYEDDNVIVIDKPQGLVVHPGAGNISGTLVNGLLAHCRELAACFPGAELRPGIVHRLDKDTSGVLITAKHPEAHEFLSSQFRSGRVKKTYLAVVKGGPALQEGVVDINLRRDARHRQKFAAVGTGGKRAVTRYRLLKASPGYALMELRPRTGRTHQLRVHMKYAGCPILGDPLYSREDSRFPAVGLMLHAMQLTICLPGQNAPHTFISPLPGRFADFYRVMGWA